MPPLIPFLVAVGSAIASVGTFVIGLGVSLAVGQISKLFIKKGAKSSVAQANAEKGLTVRQSVAPRRVIYGGPVVVGGVITYIETSSGGGPTNSYLHLVITLTGHEVYAISGMYFDGVLVPVDGNGDASSGDFAGLARVKYNLGTRDQVAFPDLVSESGGAWTVDHRQRGCAGAYVRLFLDQDKFSGGLPNITFAVHGKKVYDPRIGMTTWTDNAALCIADYLNDQTMTQGLRYESQSQQAIFPGDKGFDFVPTIQEKNLRWGSQSIPVYYDYTDYSSDFQY